MNKIIISIVVLSLVGCTRINAFDKTILEPAADQAYETAIRALCAAPADVHARQKNAAIVIPTLPKLCPTSWGVIRALMMEDEP